RHGGAGGDGAEGATSRDEAGHGGSPGEGYQGRRGCRLPFGARGAPAARTSDLPGIRPVHPLRHEMPQSATRTQRTSRRTGPARPPTGVRLPPPSGYRTPVGRTGAPKRRSWRSGVDAGNAAGSGPGTEPAPPTTQGCGLAPGPEDGGTVVVVVVVLLVVVVVVVGAVVAVVEPVSPPPALSGGVWPAGGAVVVVVDSGPVVVVVGSGEV